MKSELKTILQKEKLFNDTVNFTFAVLHYFEWLGTSDQDGEYIVKSNCLADM